MIRFNRSEPKARNYLLRREQLRLLLLFVPLVLVIAVMGRLRDPAVASRIDGLFGQVAAGDFPPSIVSEPADREFEGGTPAAPEPSSAGAADVGRAAEESGPQQPSSDKQVEASPGSKRFAGVKPDWLAAVVDNSYFRNAEQDGWFGFLGLLQRATPDELKAADALAASYVQLVDQPGFYRGKLVEVQGFVRQISEQAPAPNELGIKKYYRVILQPADGTSWPIIVYSLGLPPNLSVGEKQAGDFAKVRGLFFKKLSYEWKDGLGTAPVIVAKDIEHVGATAPGSASKGFHQPAASTLDAESPRVSADRAGPEGAKQTTSFRDVLEIAGWNTERLAELDSGNVLTNDTQRIQALELLRRLRSFNTADLREWVHEGLQPQEVVKDPGDHRGQLVHLAGRVRHVRPKKLPADVAVRLEMPEYFECDVTLDGEMGSAHILTTRIPAAWRKAAQLDEPFSAVALYVSRGGSSDPPYAVWLAKELSWHPGRLGDQQVGGLSDPSLGRALLGSLGMDVGLLDDIQSRGVIRPEEREAFYQMLNAVGGISANQLVQSAEQNLPAASEEWRRQLAAAGDPQRQALAKEVIRKADKGRYSVVPLFNDAPNQVGRLFVFDGTARRVARVEVGEHPEGGSSDIAERFGIDHFYEMDVFTEDSQNYALVFCFRELPPGFPLGEGLYEPVRVAGFFFKDWRYHARGRDDNGQSGEPNARVQDIQAARVAPLLIGRAPLALQPERGGGSVSPYVGVGLFLLGLGGVWALAAAYARSDRRFRKKIRAVDYDLPAGKSLNELDLAARELPEKAAGAASLPTGDSS